MKKYSVRHLPVVEGPLFVGLITESDLREVMLPSLVRDIPVEQIMIEDPVTVGPNDSLEDAARIIYRDKIGGLPVVDKGKLVGILRPPPIFWPPLSSSWGCCNRVPGWTCAWPTVPKPSKRPPGSFRRTAGRSSVSA